MLVVIFLHTDPHNTIPTTGTICDLIRMILTHE